MTIVFVLVVFRILDILRGHNIITSLQIQLTYDILDDDDDLFVRISGKRMESTRNDNVVTLPACQITPVNLKLAQKNAKTTQHDKYFRQFRIPFSTLSSCHRLRPQFDGVSHHAASSQPSSSSRIGVSRERICNSCRNVISPANWPCPLKSQRRAAHLKLKDELYKSMRRKIRYDLFARTRMIQSS